MKPLLKLSCYFLLLVFSFNCKDDKDDDVKDEPDHPYKIILADSIIRPFSIATADLESIRAYENEYQGEMGDINWKTSHRECILST